MALPSVQHITGNLVQVQWLSPGLPGSELVSPLQLEAKGIMACDPFVTLDEDGVGELMKLAMSRGQSTRPNMKMGICGEHGGDPASIDFCQRRSGKIWKDLERSG